MLLFLTIQLAFAAPADPVVGGVGLVPIRLSELEEEARFEHVDLSKPLSAKQKRWILSRVAQRKHLARRARRLGYLADPEIERALVARMEADETPSAEPTDAELRAWYDAHVTDYTRQLSVTAWRVVVRVGVTHSDAEARAIADAAHAEIAAHPERFMLVAHRVAEPGVLLDCYTEKRAAGPPPEWFRAARSAPLGALSEVRKTREGYEIFVVTDRDGSDPETFENMRARVRRDVLQDRVRRLGVEEPPGRLYVLWWWHAPMKRFGAGRTAP